MAGAVGYQLLSGDDSSPLADQDNTLESGGSDADYETFGTADEALAWSSLVVTGVPLSSESWQGGDNLPVTVTEVEVTDTLYGEDHDAETIGVRQIGAPQEEGLGVDEYYVHLADLEADEVLLFLVEYGDTGDYQPINPSDGIHTVEEGAIAPAVEPSRIELPETLEELREQIHQYEDTESQH